MVDDEVLTTAEAADLLRLSANYVRRLAREERLPSYRLPGGREFRYVRRELLEWVSSRHDGQRPERVPQEQNQGPLGNAAIDRPDADGDPPPPANMKRESGKKPRRGDRGLASVDHPGALATGVAQDRLRPLLEPPGSRALHQSPTLRALEDARKQFEVLSGGPALALRWWDSESFRGVMGSGVGGPAIAATQSRLEGYGGAIAGDIGGAAAAAAVDPVQKSMRGAFGMAFRSLLPAVAGIEVPGIDIDLVGSLGRAVDPKAIVEARQAVFGHARAWDVLGEQVGDLAAAFGAPVGGSGLLGQMDGLAARLRPRTGDVLGASSSLFATSSAAVAESVSALALSASYSSISASAAAQPDPSSRLREAAGSWTPDARAILDGLLSTYDPTARLAALSRADLIRPSTFEDVVGRGLSQFPCVGSGG